MLTDGAANTNSELQPAFEPRGPLDGYIYEQLANHIERLIKSGFVQKRLPAEKRIADEYGVSLGTARRATELLRERGLVVTLRSKGSFVTGTRGPAAPGEGVSEGQPKPAYSRDQPVAEDQRNGSLIHIWAGPDGE